jgi:hypothetical protein
MSALKTQNRFAVFAEDEKKNTGRYIAPSKHVAKASSLCTSSKAHFPALNSGSSMAKKASQIMGFADKARAWAEKDEEQKRLQEIARIKHEETLKKLEEERRGLHRIRTMGHTSYIPQEYDDMPSTSDLETDAYGYTDYKSHAIDSSEYEDMESMESIEFNEDHDSHYISWREA